MNQKELGYVFHAFQVLMDEINDAIQNVSPHPVKVKIDIWTEPEPDGSETIKFQGEIDPAPPEYGTGH